MYGERLCNILGRMIFVQVLQKALSQRHPLRILWHRGKTCCAALAYRFPARKLVIIGITGTDGKTTTVGMLSHILKEAHIRHGALSTAFFLIGDTMEWNTTQKTSPSPFTVQRFLRQCVTAKCTHAILECSSHGLVQGRLNFIWPTVAAITNTSPEHLDYHGTFEQYKKDKAILFYMLNGKGTKVLNKDDCSDPLLKNIPSAHIQEYSYHLQPITSNLTLNIPGSFNIENAMCAIACAEAIGVNRDAAIEALKTFPTIPGRMEKIEEGQPFDVIIDFTVTPVAYQKTLSALCASLPPDKRLLVLTGSCGDRMKEKRPIIGRICSTLADIVVVSNEDPYTEDPEKIIDDVISGTRDGKASVHRIIDRTEAIRFLFKKAQPGDTVLLCGKGSDTTMWTKEGQIPWNEREIARELLHPTP